MNKRQIVASLNSIANELDTKGLFKEANEITEVMVRISQLEGQNETRTGIPAETDEQKADFAIANARAKMADGDVAGALKELTDVGKQIDDENVALKLVKVYNEIAPAVTKPNGSNSSQNTPVATPAGKPKPSVPGKPSQPSSKPGMPSKPGSLESSAPKSSEGLSRWVNKAENIYSAWVSKGAKHNSTDAEGLIQDIIDYMEKVKLNMKPSLHSAADYKIDKVKTLKAAIASGINLPGYAIATTPYGSISGVKPYGDVSGFPGKGVNPFGTGQRLTGNALDYQARNEGKSY